MMMSLIDFPEGLKIVIFSEYCTPRDVMGFDSACSSKTERPSFLEFLCSKVFEMDLCDRGSVIRWMTFRHVRSKQLLLRGMDTYLLKYLPLNISKIVKVVIHRTENLNDFDRIISQFINSCVNLRSIESFLSVVVTDDLILKFEPALLGQLTHLDIQKTDVLSDRSFVHLANCCKLLKLLKFEAASGISERSILNLIKQNCDLETFHIVNQIENEDFDGEISFQLKERFYLVLAENCPRLVNVRIFSTHLVSSEMILLCIEKLKSLTEFILETELFLEPFFQYDLGCSYLCLELAHYDLYFSPILTKLESKITNLIFNFTTETKRLLGDTLKYCRFNLTHLELNHCKGYSVSDLRDLIEGCQSLVSFELSDIHLLTSDLMSLFTVHYSFTSLKLSDIRHTTSDEALVFLDANPRLVYCDIFSKYFKEDDVKRIEEYMLARRKSIVL